MSDDEDIMRYMLDQIDEQRARGMSSPVRCSCGQIYDLGKVKVYARYADCSCWMTPCCNRHEDDRIGIRKYTELPRVR